LASAERAHSDRQADANNQRQTAQRFTWKNNPTAAVSTPRMGRKIPM